MRNVAIVLLLSVFAFQTLAADEEAYARAKTLINRGLGANFDQIRDASRYLTPVEKDRLWDRFSAGSSNKALTGLALNAFLGLGIGSFVIGDKDSGLLSLALDLGGGLAFIIGYVGSVYSFFGDASLPAMVVIGIVGLAVRLGSFIYQLISPFTYVKEYDEMLAEALRLASLDASIQPYLASRSDGGGELGLRLAL